MARYTASLAVQSSNVYVFTVHKPRNGSDCCTFTVAIGGTFGGGTATINLSPDNGVTLFPLAPINGSSPSITAAGAYTFKVGNSDANSTAPDIYVALGVAAGPSLTIYAYDNN
jgi:hypothetical protein